MYLLYTYMEQCTYIKLAVHTAVYTCIFKTRGGKGRIYMTDCYRQCIFSCYYYYIVSKLHELKFSVFFMIIISIRIVCNENPGSVCAFGIRYVRVMA